jgi:Flp pilus assembly protein TadG
VRAPVHPARRGARGRDENGGIALLAALVSLVLMVVAALTVDLGSTWATRGQLQLQADHAALFAAERLPATSDATRLVVASEVAYSICRHPVRGQRELTPAFPDCPDTTTTTSPQVTAFARYLLDEQLVQFPDSNQVYVKTPPARIDYSFGRAAGVDGSTQQKVAVARVGSPGSVEPIGLSLTCLLSAAGNLPSGLGSTLSGVLPLNYMAPGPLTVDSPPNKWPASDARSAALKVTSLTPGQLTQGINSGFTLVGSGWLAGTVRLSFLLGDESDPAQTGKYTRVDKDYVGVAGTVQGLAFPGEVVSKPGTWDVKVAVKNLDGSYTYSQQPYPVVVRLPEVTADLLGCGRMLKSPRANQDDDPNGTRRNLQHNLQEGLDHGVTQYPHLLSTGLPTPVTAGSLLTALDGGLTQCPNNTSPAVTDVSGNLVNGQVPNCMVYQNGSSTTAEFTDGMLGAPTTVALSDGTTKQVAGRLVCTSARPCRHATVSASSLGLSGSYEVNDDRFEDYVDPDRQSLITAATFFNLSTFVDDGVPVVTPKDAIEPEIYSSQRFFWVPVLSTVLAPNDSANDAGGYPVLTFRPVFVTQKTPTGVTSVDLVLDLVDLWVRTLLGIDATDDHGILMQGDQLRALRFMTIEPSALPSVPSGYDGPVSDYLGVGPKIIKLVR